MAGRVLQIVDLGAQLYALGMLDPADATPIAALGTMTSVDRVARDRIVRALAGGNRTVVEIAVVADLDASNGLSAPERATLIAAASVVLRAETNAAARAHQAALDRAAEKYARCLTVARASG